ncbi:MAG TPA: hypothetical protein VNW53_15420 [Phenylobacterium sp.]|jgi:hypothetical protein|uniref:hypothetical protein n=1 Tax=Phenylobacterium sp. TaxID=1871053 RepID=UPI002B7D9397|nr:hypothetical protein [Phenylobacterium sp.]HXA40387.1 hypothetical protein [Phenylobacterium sp.]
MIGIGREAARRLALAIVLSLGAAAPVWAQGGAAPYATMAPLGEYLMADRGAEIALARSAAPPAISDDATIMVLGRGGYEVAAKGKNGFVCLVERAWTAPFDFPEFWNPKMRGPVCYNPAAVRSILPDTVKRTSLALAGRSKPAMLKAIKAAVARKALPTPQIGAMSYMMSHQQYLNDGAGSWAPHLMFYVPRTGAAAWGANLPASPIMLDTDHTEMPESESIFMMTATKWSDGTPFVQGEDHNH